MVCLVLAIPLARWAQTIPSHPDPLLPFVEYASFIGAALLLWLAATWFFQLYVSFRTRSVWPEIGRIAKALVAVALVQVAAIFFLRLHEDVSRLFFGTYFAIAFAAPRRATGSCCAPPCLPVRRGGLNTRVFAVVGSGDLAHDVVSTVDDHPEWGLAVRGTHPRGRGQRGARESSSSARCRSSARSSTTTSSTR